MYLILLAGDDDVLLTILAQIFQREGYEAVIAHDETSLKASLEKQKPDICILDFSRSPSRGLRLLDALGDTARNRSIILANQLDIAHLRSLTTEISGEFIPKPFAMAELLARVKALLKQN